MLKGCESTNISAIGRREAWMLALTIKNQIGFLQEHGAPSMSIGEKLASVAIESVRFTVQILSRCKQVSNTTRNK